MSRLSLSGALRISRPRFWIYILGPFMLGVLGSTGSLQALLSWKVLLFAFYFTFPANLLIYGVNDIFDYETDRLNPKKQGYELALSPERRGTVLHLMALTNIPFLIAAFFLPTSAYVALFVFLFLSLFYSAPPIRAKAKPMLDSLFNVLYLVPGLMGYALFAQRYPSTGIVLAASFWCMAMHAYSAAPDIEADKKAGVSTIATWLGRRMTLIVCLGFYIASAVFAFPYASLLVLPLGTIYVVLMILSLMKKDEAGLLRLYRFFPVVNTVAGASLFFFILAQRF